MRILVVDDDPNTQKGLAALLQMEGHLVDACEDAKAAAELLARETYDLLLTDHVMPGTSGLELTSVARSLQPQIRCCVLSGQPRPARAGRDVVWFDKPIDIDIVLEECARMTASLGR